MAYEPNSDERDACYEKRERHCAVARGTAATSAEIKDLGILRGDLIRPVPKVRKGTDEACHPRTTISAPS
ncbi:hypothetical protein [Nocardia sp. R6R-6]|uniref:hypothetical protein n=1 Tax=Nocardia sp. R6R-6 TaxID=3459303 RepID=UPI00403DEE44